MILFILSFILILITSYLITSICEQKETRGIVYFLLITFAQIILNFELLSLFNQIAQIPFIILNTAWLIFSGYLWNKFKRPVFKPKFKNTFRRIVTAIKLDKLLLISIVALLFFIGINLFLSIISPIHISDAMAYHVPRAIRWIINGNLSHYATTDMRMLTMPINSELVYAYLILFLRHDVLLNMLAFLGYINSIIVIYAFLGDLGFCTRKKLWTIFVFSAFPFVLAETSSQDTNMFLGSMLLTTIYLFHNAVKNKNKFALYFSSLTLAIAFGIKTTALIAAPSMFLVMCYISYLYEKKRFLSPLLKFSCMLLVNFLIFSAYNYVLNYINYSDFITTQEQYELNKFRGGKKAYCSNLIKYSFMLFDFSGIKYMNIFNDFFKYLNEALHALIGITPDTFASHWLPQDSGVNTKMLETRAGLGLLSCFAFLPSILISIFKFKNKIRIHNRKSILMALALSYVFNILLFSGLMVFTYFNVRYLTTFTMLAIPTLVCTYIKSWKNVYKWLIIIIASYYLFYVSCQIPLRNIQEIARELKHNFNIHLVRDKMRCEVASLAGKETCDCRVTDILKKEKNSKIAFFANYGEFLYNYEYLNLHGYHIDYLLFEEFDINKILEYDIILVHPKLQLTHSIKNYEQGRKKYKLINGQMIYDQDSFAECYYYDYRFAYIFDNNKNNPLFSICFTPYDKILDLGYKFFEYVPNNKYSPQEDNKDIFIFKKIK